ncbi:MAG: hypothetical protein Q4P34_08400 [Tissierellia bacterium]|nr:hypothetical protein [Tissierellia bacterium]
MSKTRKYILYGLGTLVLLALIFFIFLQFNFRPTPEDKRNTIVNNVKMEVKIPGEERNPIIRTYELEEYESLSQEKKDRIKDEIKGRIEGDIPCVDIVLDPNITFIFYDGDNKVEPEGDVKIVLTAHHYTYNDKYDDSKLIDGLLTHNGGVYTYRMEEFLNNEEKPFIEYSEIEVYYELNGVEYISLLGVHTTDDKDN